MEFTNSTLAALMRRAPDGPETTAKRANLCMEERVSAGRQATYEQWIGDPDGWDGWQEMHHRYVEEEVRRRHPLSAAFIGGEPSLRRGIEPNQHISIVLNVSTDCLLPMPPRPVFPLEPNKSVTGLRHGMPKLPLQVL